MKKNGKGIPTTIVQPLFMQDEILETQAIDSEKITVREVFEKQNFIEYEYDFGDSWIHKIKLNRFIENCNDPYARCVELVGDAPMEDCGGAYGFDELMKILIDPNHSEYDDIVDDAFARVKQTLIKMISENNADGEYAVDLLMIAKYFERIGDHAVNIAEWVEFSVTGVHKGE